MWIRLLIYLLPAVIDAVIAQLLFVNAVRAARMGSSALGVAGVVTAWSVVYAVTNPLIGRRVTSRNAARMMIGACLGLALTSTLFIFAPSLPAMYALVSLSGVATAFFFAPFQVFMKAVDTAGGRPLRSSAGLYTFAWSMGFAVGPFISGFLMELGASQTRLAGWQIAYVLGCITALLCAGGILRLKHLVEEDSQPTDAGASPAPTPAHAGEPGMPDLAWLGWVVGGVGTVALTMIRGVFPARAVTFLHLPPSVQGTYFFLMSMTQGLAALALIRSRWWMYQPAPALLFGLAGAAGAVLTGWGAAPLTLYCAGICFGVYSGSFFFYLVFHALAHPENGPRNVTWNEMVVGIGGILGPTVGGLLGDSLHIRAPYGAAAGLVLAAALFQAFMHARAAKCIRN